MSVSESLSASSSLVAVVLSVASVADGASVTSGACARPAASPSVHGACGCRPPGRRTAFALNTDALVPYVANLTSICRGFPPGRPSRFTRSISLGSTGIRNFLLKNFAGVYTSLLKTAAIFWGYLAVVLCAKRVLVSNIIFDAFCRVSSLCGLITK